MTTLPTVGYAGMTHLGLCSAIAAASKGFPTIGFTADPGLAERLQLGELPVVEPGLGELLAENSALISFSSETSVLSTCDLIYVAPDVPTDDAGASDLREVDALLELVLAHSRSDAVVVVLSQVPPGYTRARQRPSRLLYYQVETLVFGRAVERATTPERFIVGCPDTDGSLPPALQRFLASFGCPILPMRFESAELTKISINCCLVASVSVANTLAELCEKIGADWSEIVPALKLDRRIGAYSYLTPGLGIAGGNLERDLATVRRFSQELGTEADVMKAFVANSRHRKNWPLRTLHETVLSTNDDVTLGILGLAYKENTHSIKNSPAVELIQHLTPWRLQVYDPVIRGPVGGHPRSAAARSAIEAARGVDALVIMTPWAEFRDLRCDSLAEAMRGRLVLDPYRVLEPPAARAAGLDYRTLGVA